MPSPLSHSLLEGSGPKAPPRPSRIAPLLWAACLGLGVPSAWARPREAPGRPVFWRALDLNRKGAWIGSDEARRIGSEKDSSGPERTRLAWTWTSGDQETSQWYPQGITGLPDHRLLVSWYHKGDKGVRVSFVDLEDPESVPYRHVLLVEPSSEDPRQFRPIDSHAGGLARIGSKVYVMNSSKGVRVFDLEDLYRAELDPKKSKVGWIEGEPFALNYRYYWIQEAFLDLGGQDPAKFSWASVDWSPVDRGGPQPWIVTGNYHADEDPYDNPPAGMNWWRTSPELGLEKIRDSRSLGASFFPRNQGGATRQGWIFTVHSGSEAQLQIARDLPRGLADYVSFPWAHGTEDLHISRDSGLMWSLTEHPKRRMVFAVAWRHYLKRLEALHLNWPGGVSPAPSPEPSSTGFRPSVPRPASSKLSPYEVLEIPGKILGQDTSVPEN